MYLKYDPKYWAIDIEGDLIPSTRVWCAVAINVMSGEELEFRDNILLKEWINARKAERCKFVGHNIIGYDAPTLNRIVGTKLTLNDLIDTMILSMLYSPSLADGHSLEAWGHRLKFPKGDFSDFSQFSEEMLTYCRRDTQLCRRVYMTLQTRMSSLGFSELGCEIEHRAWHLVKKQQENGFAFNYKEAHILYAELRNFENEIRDDIYKYWPPELQIVQRYKQAKKKDGSPTANFLKHKEQYVRLEELNDGGYVAWDYVAFNIGSPDQRREKLLELGWKPEEFTKPSKTHPKGQAKLTDKGKLVPSLEAFVEAEDKEEVRLIAKWIDVNARANMVNTWMEAYNDKTGCIHGSLWLANTLRYRHSNPNTANIPAVRTYDDHPLRGKAGVYTYEARDLWTVRALDRRLVGVDAKGIQLRVLAHYLNNPKFTEAVLAGDPHAYNQEVGGFKTRAVSKTFIYAFLLGAGDAKIGQIVGGSARDGRDLKARFIGNFPGLAELLNSLQTQVDRTGRIKLIDGTPLAVDKPHTRLGYLLQGDESRIMKQAAINADLEIRKRRLDVLKVCDIHDEFQFDVFKDSVDDFKNIVLPTAFRLSGERFNYRLPVACDVKVGMTWSETH